MKKTTEKSAGVFLYNEKTGKFLLLKRSEGSYWEFPKGHIEKRETHKDTLKRELREETGIIQFDILGRAGSISFVLKRKEDWHVLRIVTYYNAKTKQEQVQLSREHSEYAWLDSAKVQGYLNFENIRQLFLAQKLERK